MVRIQYTNNQTYIYKPIYQIWLLVVVEEKKKAKVKKIIILDLRYYCNYNYFLVRNGIIQARVGFFVNGPNSHAVLIHNWKGPQNDSLINQQNSKSLVIRRHETGQQILASSERAQ